MRGEKHVSRDHPHLHTTHTGVADTQKVGVKQENYVLTCTCNNGYDAIAGKGGGGLLLPLGTHTQYKEC